MRIKLNNKTSNTPMLNMDIPIYLNAKGKENIARYAIEGLIQSIEDEVISAIADNVIDKVICSVIEQEPEEIIDGVIEQENCIFVNTIQTEDLAKQGNCDESDCVDFSDEYEEESDFSVFE